MDTGFDITSLIKTEYEDNLYTVYDVEIRYRARMLGGIPRNLDTALLMAEAHMRKAKAPEEIVTKIKEEVSARMGEAEASYNKEEVDGEDHPVIDKSWVMFWSDEEGIYVESRTMKSAIRECMSKLGIFQSRFGTKGTHDYGLFVEPARLRFTRNGEVLKVPDGFQDRSITVSTAQGKRTSIKREDYVDQADLKFRIKVIQNGLISEPDLIKALALVQDAGHGGARSQGFGQLDIEQCVRVKGEALKGRPPKEKPAKKGKKKDETVVTEDVA